MWADYCRIGIVLCISPMRSPISQPTRCVGNLRHQRNHDRPPPLLHRQILPTRRIRKVSYSPPRSGFHAVTPSVAWHSLAVMARPVGERSASVRARTPASNALSIGN